MFNYKYGGKVDLRSQSWYVKPEKELLESREQAGRDLLSLFGTETTTNNLVDKGYLSLAFKMVGAPNEGLSISIFMTRGDSSARTQCTREPSTQLGKLLAYWRVLPITPFLMGNCYEPRSWRSSSLFKS